MFLAGHVEGGVPVDLLMGHLLAPAAVLGGEDLK
jgi:hypothetical protein